MKVSLTYGALLKTLTASPVFHSPRMEGADSKSRIRYKEMDNATGGIFDLRERQGKLLATRDFLDRVKQLVRETP